ncbi:MAG TPA: hypothetical protein DCW68_00675 [Rhodospirillaceae bacterium]|nr:MAG: hypothetical protein A2018_00930 [Alphaproteobacteria bacterium GWF2_58_20]HAU28615.1 hypothetical protein [Rhodospirillaceae bacterium]
MSYSSPLGDEINQLYSLNDPLGRLFLVRLRERLALHHEASYSHCMRVGEMARQFARFVGASEMAADNLGLIVSCHDVGKLLVPPALLDKPDPTREEQEILSRHGREGDMFLQGRREPLVRMAAEVVTLHHKRFKIQQKLLGKNVPPALRIASLCDSFDSSVSMRPYRVMVTPGYALGSLIHRNATKRLSYDPNTLAFFIHFHVVFLRARLGDDEVAGLLSALRAQKEKVQRQPSLPKCPLKPSGPRP